MLIHIINEDDATNCRTPHQGQIKRAFWAARLAFWIAVTIPTMWIFSQQNQLFLWIWLGLSSGYFLLSLTYQTTKQFAYLISDILLLSGLLYFIGGATNPFISMLLIPVITGAILFADYRTWLITALCILMHTLLMFWYHPLSSDLHGHGHGFTAHIWGMWLVFLMSAVLITHSLQRLNQALFQRERQLAQLREQTLQDEQMVALGIFAAGVAHELGTPLSIISILSHELEQLKHLDPEMAHDMATISAQIEICCQRLRQLRDPTHWHQAYSSNFSELIQQTQFRWQLLRPQTPLNVELSVADVRIARPYLLGQTLMSLLNNAAESSPDGITLTGYCQIRRLVIEIHDQGAGLNAEMRAKLGQQPMSTKETGLGIGLMLATNAIHRLGGHLKFIHQPRHTVRIELPLLNV